jgi:hypothetical protein
VGFYGPLQQANLVNENIDTAGVRFASGVTLITGQIVFDNCEFNIDLHESSTPSKTILPPFPELNVGPLTKVPLF